MPRLRYAAGRLGSGSDVLGFDDAMSRDHDWGCRLTLLVDEPDRAAVPQVSLLLDQELPESYRGSRSDFPSPGMPASPTRSRSRPCPASRPVGSVSTRPLSSRRRTG